MSITTQITRIQNEVSSQHELLEQVNAKLQEKGATVPTTDSASDYNYSYTVNPVAGAVYGFKKNAAGYYESTNQGIDNSFSICRVNFTVTKTGHIYFKVINSAQVSGDYGIFGKLNVPLALTNTLDAEYEKQYRQVDMAEPYSLTYLNVDPGEYFIDIKYIKNAATSQNNDSLQFLVEDGYEIPRISLENNTAKLQDILTMADTIPEGGGTELPELTTPATAADLRSGKELIDAEGNKITGTMPDSTQSDITISVATTGRVTAKLTQTEGHVAEATIRGATQLSTQTAKTITPTKSSQTAVAKGRYTTGAVTVAAIPAQYITTTDATATAADMRSGKTGYVNGSKVTGSIADFDGSYECSGESTGGSSGGANLDTCSITIDLRKVASTVSYTMVDESNNIVRGDVDIRGTSSVTLDNVLKETLLQIAWTGTLAPTDCVTTGEVYATFMGHCTDGQQVNLVVCEVLAGDYTTASVTVSTGTVAPA